MHRAGRVNHQCVDIDPFQASVRFLYPIIIDNFCFSDIFRVYRNGTFIHNFDLIPDFDQVTLLLTQDNGLMNVFQKISDFT